MCATWSASVQDTSHSSGQSARQVGTMGTHPGRGIAAASRPAPYAHRGDRADDGWHSAGSAMLHPGSANASQSIVLADDA
jgi:hypothetical protein